MLLAATRSRSLSANVHQPEGGSPLYNTDESVIVRASMTALEYRESAWRAHRGHAPPPEPSPLSDRALYAIMAYEERDLPPAAQSALEAECQRRGLLAGFVDRLITVAVLALLGLVGIVIGWVLLNP
jgi:hypothetical protein